MKTDIEIAQETKLIPINELAHSAGLADSEFEPYGRDKAKVTLDPSRQEKGRLILVTATSGMPAGSGKTTTSIALAQGLKRLGKNAALALREPSLGPVFGMKGGAAGGGYSAACGRSRRERGASRFHAAAPDPDDGRCLRARPEDCWLP